MDTANPTPDVAATYLVQDAMRFLALAADLDAHTPEYILPKFLEIHPRAFSAPLLKKSAALPATAGDPAWAGRLLPPALLDPLIAQLQRTIALARIPGALRAPFGVPIPSLTTPPAMAWVGEAKSKPVTNPQIASTTLFPSKAAGIIPVSEELVRLTGRGAETVMSAYLIAAAAAFLDRALLDPTMVAVPDQNPGSITSGVTVTPPATTFADNVGVVLGALFAQRPHTSRPVLLMSATTAGRLGATGAFSDLTTEGGMAIAPVVITPGALNHLIAIDAPALAYADGGAEIDTSRHASIQMDTAPTNPPTAATVQIDLWSRNLRGFRLDRFVSWTIEAGAVAYTTPSAA